MDPPLYGLAPKVLEPQSNHKIDIREIPAEGWATKSLTGTPQNCQEHQKIRAV